MRIEMKQRYQVFRRGWDTYDVEDLETKKQAFSLPVAINGEDRIALVRPQNQLGGDGQLVSGRGRRLGLGKQAPEGNVARVGSSGSIGPKPRPAPRHSKVG